MDSLLEYALPALVVAVYIGWGLIRLFGRRS